MWKKFRDRRNCKQCFFYRHALPADTDSDNELFKEHCVDHRKEFNWPKTKNRPCWVTMTARGLEGYNHFGKRE